MFYPDWKEIMFGRNISGLEDDIKVLKIEAPDVLRAKEQLDKQIFDGINNRQLRNGSHVKTTVLDTLNANQRQRALANLDGRFYEHRESHHQYKVVIDAKNGELALVSEELSPEHLCICHTQ